MLKLFSRAERSLIYVLPEQIIVVDLATRKETLIDLPGAVARFGEIRDAVEYRKILSDKVGSHIRHGDPCVIAMDERLVFHRTPNEGKGQSATDTSFTNLIPVRPDELALCQSHDGTQLACDRNWFAPIIDQCRASGTDVSFVFPTLVAIPPFSTKKPWIDAAKRFQKEKRTWKSANFLRNQEPREATPSNKTQTRGEARGHVSRLIVGTLAVSVFMLSSIIAFRAWNNTPSTTISGTGASIPAAGSLEASLIHDSGSGSVVQPQPTQPLDAIPQP